MVRVDGRYGTLKRFHRSVLRSRSTDWKSGMATLRCGGGGRVWIMPEIRFVASGRALLAVEAIGEGPPVVFLHSNAGDRREWGGVMASLGLGHQAIAYDRRGFGKTRAQREDHSAVADLFTTLDALTDEAPAVLVGCSMGGKLALDAALRHPARVRGLVLIAPSVAGAPPPDYSPEVAEVMAWARAEEASGNLDRAAAAKAQLWLDGPFVPEGRVGGNARRLFLDAVGIALRAASVGPNLDDTAAYERFAELGIPVLVIQGDLDFPHIAARSRHVAATVPNGTSHVLADVAHLAALERPHEVADLVTDFHNHCSG